MYRVSHLTFGIWIGYKKKNLWIFFQKYVFIRQIEPFHLRMKHIIQRTATAGLTVPHSIHPIFQYIFDCLGKRSISKIVAFGAQKIQTSLLRSRCTHNEWLFGADFGTMASLGHFSSKMSKEPPLRSMVSVTVPCEFLFLKIEEHDMDDIWFQQDCHTANVTIDCLCTFFENRIISRNSDANWPPRSCDLTPLNYFLWGAVKNKCYANHTETNEILKHDIEVAIHGNEAQTIENVLKNWVDRMGYCKSSRGSHFNNVVFHS